MARGFDLASNSIGANPYPKPKEVVPEFTACEVCKRTIPTKNWSEHKGSKKHRKAEDEERRGKDKENFASYGGVDGVTSIDGADHWGGGGGDTWATNETDSGGAVQGGGSGRACYGCGEEGHQKRDCPKSSGGGGRACYGCGEEGHQKRDCPQSASGSGGDSRACFNCGMTGHRKADCPNGAQSAENGSGNGGQQCFNCYEYGHRKSECTKERVMKCRNCEEIGHMSRDCPKPKDWSKHQCSNCKEFGHGLKRCPQPVAEDTNGGGWDQSATSGAAGATGGWATADSSADAATGDWADADADAGTKCESSGDNWADASAGGGW